MIIDLPSTNSSTLNKRLIELREQGGSNAAGRVLTLVIITDEASAEDPIAAANAASFEHPCRVIVVARGLRRASARLDAQIRVGGDAGASEVIVLRLYGPLVDHGASVVVPLLLADAPVVAWWPGDAPDVPADDPIGALAQRRITDAAAAKRPVQQLAKRAASYRPGDTDLAWTRLTRWRGLLASALDQPPHDKVTEASVSGATDSASTDLLAGWLAVALRCPVRRVRSASRLGPGLHSVVLTRRVGDVSLVRPAGVTADLTVANQPERSVALPIRSLRECLAEELRRLDADEVYADVLSKGLQLVAETSAQPARRPVTAGSGTANSGRTRTAATSGSGSRTAGSRGRTGSRRTATSARTATRGAAAPANTADGKAAAPKVPQRRKPARAPTAPATPAISPDGEVGGTGAGASDHRHIDQAGAEHPDTDNPVDPAPPASRQTAPPASRQSTPPASRQTQVQE